MESEIRRLILQDPAYADEHGLSIAHFACRRSQDEKQQQYVMLSKLWGKKSKTIIDTKPLALQPHEKHQLGKFGDKFGYNPEDIVMRTQRRKHASESLPGAVIYSETGELEIRAPVVFAWKITLWASGIALVVYYGVGIIATNTEFSTLFQEYFFWIAIIWSLSSSALLGWLVHVLSGSKRDVLGAFLSALALWLVVIQVCMSFRSTCCSLLTSFGGTADWTDTLVAELKVEFVHFTSAGMLLLSIFGHGIYQTFDKNARMEKSRSERARKNSSNSASGKCSTIV